jgi:hypothetical protein
MTKVLRSVSFVCFLAFSLVACSYQKSSPTMPETPAVEASNPASPVGEAGASANRAPDPADGDRLPLPDMSHVVHHVAAQFPDALRSSCQDHGGSWEFLDRLVDELRTHDTRWGYNWKRGNVGDPSKDVVDYHWGAGEDENSTDVYIVDVILGHCGDNPTPGWGDVTDATRNGGSIGRWTALGRF